MSLCYEFEKWTMVRFALVSASLVTGLSYWWVNRKFNLLNTNLMNKAIITKNNISNIRNFNYVPTEYSVISLFEKYTI